MGKNPVVGMVLGVLAVGFAVFSMTTRNEAPPAGYEFLDYSPAAFPPVSTYFAKDLARASYGALIADLIYI